MNISGLGGPNFSGNADKILNGVTATVGGGVIAAKGAAIGAVIKGGLILAAPYIAAGAAVVAVGVGVVKAIDRLTDD